jgi:hypothetical protein
MAKAKLIARQTAIKSFYDCVEAGVMNVNDAKLNVETSGHKLTTGEADKFLEANPDVDKEKFLAFCKATGALSNAKKGGQGHGGSLKLNTEANAIACGVTPENVPAYLDAVNTIYKNRDILNGLIKKGLNVSFSIPKGRGEKPAEKTAQTS